MDSLRARMASGPLDGADRDATSGRLLPPRDRALGGPAAVYPRPRRAVHEKRSCRSSVSAAVSRPSPVRVRAVPSSWTSDSPHPAAASPGGRLRACASISAGHARHAFEEGTTGARLPSRHPHAAWLASCGERRGTEEPVCAAGALARAAGGWGAGRGCCAFGGSPRGVRASPRVGRGIPRGGRGCPRGIRGVPRGGRGSPRAGRTRIKEIRFIVARFHSSIARFHSSVARFHFAPARIHRSLARVHPSPACLHAAVAGADRPGSWRDKALEMHGLVQTSARSKRPESRMRVLAHGRGSNAEPSIAGRRCIECEF
jgi:hypothetical protein